ncbi:hypothetical protein GIB67_027835 [Kingdonia uniflora]|uniref:Uncharacterized protein n=1 Tax=Kingdonia uniflora TaxID=39325 RepID=A0A7J7P5G2_9MAGN|nr:hypothetical protein GIB67_027835 [Kingdonia uniflora]
MERGQQNKLINEESCYDGKVALSKRYKASDMESGKDASVLELRMVHTRGNKCQPHEREKINSSSSSPNNRFTTKDLESKQRERRKIRGINQEFSEDDKRLKRAKGSRSRRWEYNSIVRRKLDSSADSHPDIKVDDLKEVDERARLAILQGKEDTSQMADTYAEEEEEEVEMLGVMDSLDGVSPQTVFDNQGDDVELPVDGSEKDEIFDLEGAAPDSIIVRLGQHMMAST